MHGDTLSYAESFEAALAGLFEKQLTQVTYGDEPLSELAASAQMAFRDYLALQANAQFEEAAIALRRLSELSESMRTAADAASVQ